MANRAVTAQWLWCCMRKRIGCVAVFVSDSSASCQSNRCSTKDNPFRANRTKNLIKCKNSAIYSLVKSPWAFPQYWIELKIAVGVLFFSYISFKCRYAEWIKNLPLFSIHHFHHLSLHTLISWHEVSLSRTLSLSAPSVAVFTPCGFVAYFIEKKTTKLNIVFTQDDIKCSQMTSHN